MNDYIDTDTLSELFYGSVLAETECVVYKYDSTDNSVNKIRSFEMTPLSKMIYDSVSTNKKTWILRDMMADDNYISGIDDFDPDYLEKLENKELGFYMEDYVCHNMQCPVCNTKSLRRYNVKNMPVVDVICTNIDEHEGKIKLFQIKTTLGHKYFDRKKQTLLVGSKKYGYMCHEISGRADMSHKNLLVGYICINMVELDDNKYKIDNRDSFVLVPDVKNKSDNNYYRYTGKKTHFGNEIIQWNPTMVNIYDINNFMENTNVDTTTVYNISDIMLNPYDRVAQKLIF